MLERAAAGLAVLRRWLRPVTSAELPHLRAQLLMASRLFTAAITVANSALLGVAALMPADQRWAWIGAVLLLLSISAVAFVASWTPVGRARTELLMHGLILGTVCSPFVSPELAEAGLIAFVPALPLGIATFVPWRPTHSIALIPVLAAMPWILPPPADGLPVAPSLQVTMTVIMGTLAASSNQFQRRLLARLESTQSKLIGAERLSSLGRMTAGVAHELKTPLAAARNELAQIKSLTVELTESIGHPDVTNDDLHEICGELSRS
ncbi:MAG: hypothetical protein ACOCUS_04700, partial [Polyangiales bacterium]